MASKSSPVFIIGGSRTGSEMLKKMLSATEHLDLVDELFLRCPAWLHTDVESLIRKDVGGLEQSGSLDRLIDLLYSGKPFGWFWSVVDRELDKDQLRAELAGKPLSLPVIFESIMLVHARMRNKQRIGAKFPLHYSRVDDLLDWYPNCRLVHTTRNPKAVYASQAKKYVGSDESIVRRAWTRFQHFTHINIQTYWTARVHERLRCLEQYRLVKYEDVVARPEAKLRELCDFIGMPYDEKMLYPKKHGSSFESIGEGRGVDVGAVERWRSAVSPLTAAFIDRVHRSSSKALGYVN